MVPGLVMSAISALAGGVWVTTGGADERFANRKLETSSLFALGFGSSAKSLGQQYNMHKTSNYYENNDVNVLVINIDQPPPPTPLCALV